MAILRYVEMLKWWVEINYAVWEGHYRIDHVFSYCRQEMQYMHHHDLSFSVLRRGVNTSPASYVLRFQCILFQKKLINTEYVHQTDWSIVPLEGKGPLIRAKVSIKVLIRVHKNTRYCRQKYMPLKVGDPISRHVAILGYWVFSASLIFNITRHSIGDVVTIVATAFTSTNFNGAHFRLGHSESAG